MEKTYAKVMWKLSHQDGADLDALVARLIEQLQSRGRMKLLPRILAELKKLEAGSGDATSFIEVATEKEKAAATAFANDLGIKTDVVVNSSLISGWRVLGKCTLTDRSGKRALIDIYRSITQHA
jgi:F0F1-type ATP synthase delta subunit